MNNDIPAQSMSRGNSRMLRFGWVALVAVLQAACAGVGPRPAVPISEVVALSKAGTAPDQVIGRMGRTIYAPRGSDFGKLAELGVQPPVLDFIQARFVNDVELLTRNFVQGNSRGGCSDCFPQPLELSNLSTGGDGMSPDRPTGRFTGAGRPPGVPTWVPASTGTAMRNAPSLTVDEIARRAKAGESVEELVAEIHSSRLDGLISQGLLASGQISFGTRSSVGLSGSRLATLRQQGVPDPVLDAIQAQFLAQFIEIQRQRIGARPLP
jgi:hypothetical protein